MGYHFNSYIFVILSTINSVRCLDIHYSVSETGQHARMDPVDPIVKEGDNFKLVCTSPANYTGSHFDSVKFRLQHNGDNKFDTEDANSIKDVYSVKEYDIKINGQQDAGVYTCLIRTSNYRYNVNVSIQLYVIKGEGKTKFGMVGEETDISCLEASVDDRLTSIWKVNGHIQSTGRVFTIQNTGKGDAFKNYSCVVISQAAWKAYSIDSVNHNNYAKVVEVGITLSVIETHQDCNGNATCRFEALVTGVTQVEVNWLYEGVLYDPPLIETNKVTISKTPLLNFTHTSSIQLTVTDRHDTTFKKNITQNANKLPSTEDPSSNVGATVGIVIALVVIALIVIAMTVLYKKGYIKVCKDQEKVLSPTKKPFLDRSSRKEVKVSHSGDEHL